MTKLLRLRATKSVYRIDQIKLYPYKTHIAFYELQALL